MNRDDQETSQIGDHATSQLELAVKDAVQRDIKYNSDIEQNKQLIEDNIIRRKEDVIGDVNLRKKNRG